MNWWKITLISLLGIAGSAFVAKDRDDKGRDDLTGRILIRMQPVVAAAVEGNDSALLRALKASRDGHDALIAELEVKASSGE